MCLELLVVTGRGQGAVSKTPCMCPVAGLAALRTPKTAMPAVDLAEIDPSVPVPGGAESVPPHRLLAHNLAESPTGGRRSSNLPAAAQVAHAEQPTLFADALPKFARELDVTRLVPPLTQSLAETSGARATDGVPA